MFYNHGEFIKKNDTDLGSEGIKMGKSKKTAKIFCEVPNYSFGLSVCP